MKSKEERLITLQSFVSSLRLDSCRKPTDYSTDKKLLVTALQHTHNWTMGNDRFKMSFWFEALFDDDLSNDAIHELPPDDLDVSKVHEEVKNWLRRNSQKDKSAQELFEKYSTGLQLGPSAGLLPKEIEQ